MTLASHRHPHLLVEHDLFRKPVSGPDQVPAKLFRDDALRRLLLHRHLGPEVVEIPGDRGDRQHAAIALEPQQAVLAGDVPLDGELVPLFGMADVADGNVVMLAPEERDGGKSLPLPDHVERRRLALPFRNDPVLDPKGLAEASIVPAGDVPGGEYPRAACFEKRVYRHAAVDREAGPL